eukprot:gene14577-14701_t
MPSVGSQHKKKLVNRIGPVLLDFGFLLNPLLPPVLEGEDAVAKYREVMGATNPANAAEGTIRKEFAESIEANSKLSDKVLTLPNLITGVRLALTPVIVYQILKYHLWTGFVLLFIAGLTDWIDGYFARLCNTTSELGRLLDPLTHPYPFIASFAKKLDLVEPRKKLLQYLIKLKEAEKLPDLPVIGMATYNISPDKAAIYFNKVQCFCFEQQLLKPKQGMEMPVLFFLNPEFAKDPGLKDVKTITLSYTFFEYKKR